MKNPPSQYGEFDGGDYKIEGYTFQNEQISEQISDLDFSYCEFSFYNFKNTDFVSNYSITIKGSNFYSVDFTDCTFKRYQFKNCRFENIKFTNAVLLRKAVNGAFFENCILINCDFSEVDLCSGTFHNCSIKQVTLTDIKKTTIYSIGYGMSSEASHFFRSLCFIYEELAKGYKSSQSRNEEINALYLSKKYALYSECLGKKYKGSQCLNDIETIWLRIEACYKILFKGFTVWVNYYVLGFALDPFRPLKWYWGLSALGIVLFLLTGESWGESCQLQLDAIFTYGKSLSDGPKNWVQYGLFYLSSFVSLVLNGLFITAFFSYLTFNENYDA
jgi:hypothetical protein